MVGLLNTAEVYDPVLNTWTPTASNLTIKRLNHTVTRLADGRVLVAGGNGDDVTEETDSVEVYNPATNTWSVDTHMGTARYTHTATRLNDGRVLAAGGSGSVLFLDSAELYKPVSPLAPGALMLLLD